MNNWNQGVLGDFITLQRGFDLPEYERHSGNVPVVTSSGFSDFHNESKVKAPGVAMGRYGTIGAIYFIEKDFWPHNTTLYVKDFKGNDERFIYYFLKTLNYQAHNDKSSVPGVNRNHLHLISVTIPPLPEQRAIAGILGALDDKIELNRRMNRTLESMARAVFRHWFVESDEVQSWDAGRVIDDFNLTMGQSPPGETYNENGEGIPFFQGRTDFGFRFPTNRVFCTAPTRFAEEGDTLVSVRAPVGDINMAAEKSAIGRGIAAIRHKTGSRSYTYYAMHLLQEDFFRFEGEGTVFGSINRSDFENLKIAIPPVGKVKKFEMVCFPVDQMIEKNEKESRTLASLRDSLLPKLMRGEVRVKEV